MPKNVQCSCFCLSFPLPQQIFKVQVLLDCLDSFTIFSGHSLLVKKLQSRRQLQKKAKCLNKWWAVGYMRACEVQPKWVE
eukprot:c40127_g1_i1 orf=110-349(+)